ncbi:MAG: peptidoglycan editing factor PgeF [Halioglobus sp.]
MTPRYIEPDWPAPERVVALSTTRAGGYSRGVYRGLNLGHHVDDDAGAVAENRRLLQSELPAGAIVSWLTQIHGNKVISAGGEQAYPCADGAWTVQPGQVCAVLSADCLPVLLCDKNGSAVAAVHAGWRGLLSGILETSVAAMPATPGDMLAWLGPAIGPTAFEVGPEVREGFVSAAAENSRAHVDQCFVPSPHFDGRFLADLYTLARIRLAACGVSRIYGGEFCTLSDPERFYSYRRDGQTGRMATLIYLKSQ